MVHCQGQQHYVSSMASDSAVTAELASHAGHHHHVAANSTDAAATFSADKTSPAKASVCETCSDCCSIHCAPLPRLFSASVVAAHDKVLQITYFHASSVVLPQERPPKPV